MADVATRFRGAGTYAARHLSWSRPARAKLLILVTAAGTAAAPLANAAPAGAAEEREEGFSIGLGQSMRWDDNVFRVADDDDPPGGRARSDRISRTSLDLGFDHTYSLQRIVAGLQFVQRRYAEYDELDSTTRSGSLRWEWATGKRWSGTALVLQRQAPRSFDDVDRRVRSINTVRRAAAEANYWWHPDWAVAAGAERTRSRYSDDASAGSEYDETAVEAGIGYQPRSGNRLYLVYRQADGEYPNRSPSLTIDSGYTQRDLRLRGHWTLSGASRLSGYVGATRRTYDNVSRLNFGGPTGRLVYDWRPTGKLAFQAVARREIGSEYEVIDNFVVTRGVGLEGTWSATGKLAVRAFGEWLRRDFGDTRASAVDEDRRRSYGLALIYEPLRVMTVTLSAQRTRRTADGPGFDYTANIIGLDLRLLF